LIFSFELTADIAEGADAPERPVIIREIRDIRG
jgi:hypothetical protein